MRHLDVLAALIRAGDTPPRCFVENGRLQPTTDTLLARLRALRA